MLILLEDLQDAIVEEVKSLTVHSVKEFTISNLVDERYEVDHLDLNWFKSSEKGLNELYKLLTSSKRKLFIKPLKVYTGNEVGEKFDFNVYSLELETGYSLVDLITIRVKDVCRIIVSGIYSCNSYNGSLQNDTSFKDGYKAVLSLLDKQDNSAILSASFYLK